MPEEVPSIAELEYLYRLLDDEERKDLLEEILVARARGAEAMAAVVDAWLVSFAGRELIDDFGG